MGVFLRLSYREVENRSPDEQAYAFYAQALSDGLPSFRQSVLDYENDEKRWKYPPPTRVGYFALVAGAMRFLGPPGQEAGAVLSGIFSVLSLGLLILFGIRFFNPWVTLVALYWLSLSPMELVICRRSWQDGVLGFFGALLIYLTAELSRRPERKWLYAVFGASAVFTLLVKESGILVMGLCGCWLLAQRFRELGWIVLTGVMALASYFLVVGLVLGDFLAMFKVFGHIKHAIASNDYILRYQDGPWYFFPQGLWILSPLPLLAGLWGIGVAFFSKNKVWQGIAGFFIGYCIAAAVPDYFKNLRYSSAVYLIFYLMVGLGFWSILSWLKSRMSLYFFRAFFGVIFIVALAMGVSDYKNFKAHFVDFPTPDLACLYLSEMGSAASPKEYADSILRLEKL